MPNRYKIIDENESFDLLLRQVTHHSHRVIYQVDETTKTVHLLRIYHGARRALRGSDID